MTKYLTIAIAAAGCGLSFAQETPDRLTIPFSDASRPRMVKISLLHGSMLVKGYDGKEVIVEGMPGSSEGRGAPAGMRRIPMRSTGLEAEEENNVISIHTSSHSRYVDLTVQVPRGTS